MGSRHYGIDLNISRVAIGAVVVMKAIMPRRKVRLSETAREEVAAVATATRHRNQPLALAEATVSDPLRGEQPTADRAVSAE